MSRISTRLHADEDHWIPLSDIMTGLMFLFLLIALAYMVESERRSQQAKQVAVLYSQIRLNLYSELEREFHNDFTKWGAILYKDDLSIRFREPDVLFSINSTDLTPRFQSILSDFFPRYVRILTSNKYRHNVREVRIEGYTSSVWHGASLKDAYIGNMALSQRRTRSVLQYVMNLSALQPVKTQSWLMDTVTANGLSFSHLIKRNNVENKNLSQRVEFRVQTNADEQIHKILSISR